MQFSGIFLLYISLALTASYIDSIYNVTEDVMWILDSVVY